MTVGVLAIQGDFEKHLLVLRKLGVAAQEVRSSQDLEQVDRLIIPGGESTTVGMLMQRFGLAADVQNRVAEGMPIWGTCMGMILLAEKVIDGRPDQFSLNVLPVTVQRNAFGAQVHSFEAEIRLSLWEEPVTGVFIRAPAVTSVDEKVEVLGKYEDRIVAVRKDKVLGTSFHPELTDDSRLHEWFVSI